MLVRVLFWHNPALCVCRPIDDGTDARSCSISSFSAFLLRSNGGALSFCKWIYERTRPPTACQYHLSVAELNAIAVLNNTLNLAYFVRCTWQNYEYFQQDLIMFSGFTNQMSSISSWIGAKKAGGPSEESSPQNPEDEPVVTEAAATSPVTSEANGGEPEQPKADLFSSMKNQMSSWLSKKETTDQPEETKEQLTEEPVVVVEDETKAEEETGEIEGDKEGFGSGLEEVSNKAMQGARTIGSFFASAVSKAGKTVTEAGAKIKKTVEETTILSEFNKEQEAFIKSKNKMEGSIPPWVGYPEEEALKAEILSLSTDRRNFVRSPPAGVDFQFDYDSFYPIALATLAEDPNLETMRFELVPKIIKEELFWRNYFYRVSLLRQSTELSSMTQGEGNRDSANHSRESSFDEEDKTEGADTPDSPMNEFVSDSYQSNTLSKDLKEVQEGIKRLGTKKPNDEEWEKELQAELQDYELGSEGSGQTGGADADDIEEMLDAEESHGDLK